QGARARLGRYGRSPRSRSRAAPRAAARISHRPPSRKCADADRSSQPVPEQEFKRRVEVDMRNAVHRRRIDDGRLEFRYVEKGGAPGIGPRRPDLHIADEELRLPAAAYRAADHDLHALAVDL